MRTAPSFLWSCGLGLLTLLLPASAPALITVGLGNQPVPDHGWPQGAVEVANLECRVGWWEGPPFGGGEFHFLCRGNTQDFQEALATFAAMRAPVLLLVLSDGPGKSQFLKNDRDAKTDTRVDWEFVVWVPANWHRLYNNPKSTFGADSPHFREPVDPPTLRLYVGGGGVDWAKVKVPAGVKVRDERAAAAGVHPEGGALLRADIFDMATGKPVADAQIAIARLPESAAGKTADYVKVAEARTDAAGHAEIARIPAGSCQVSVVAPGYASRMLGYVQFGERSFQHFTADLAKSASLRGTVLDQNSKPLQGVKVDASSVMGMDGRGYQSPTAFEAGTDAQGRFQFTDLPTGFLQLGARAQGYTFSDYLTIHEVPAADVVLRLGSAGSIHVQVVDKDGQALAEFEGHEVLVEAEPKGGHKVGSWGGSAKVKTDGTFDFENVPPGEYRLTSHPNPFSSDRQYAPSQVITVTPGVRATAKIVYE
jgi:5-hydroxyisourate hydrolase-like protein (transthyretin family)